MKIAALILGVIGSLVVAVLGVMWAGQYQDLEKSEGYQLFIDMKAKGFRNPEMDKAMEEARAIGTAGYLNVGFGLLALLAAPFVLKFPKVSGGLMAAAALVPAAFNPKALVFSFLLLVAAVLAYLVKPRRARSAAAVAVVLLAGGLAACGGGESGPAAQANAGSGAVYSCDLKAQGGMCTEYSGEALAVGENALKEPCTALEGVFAKGLCPTAGALGTCDAGKGEVYKYFPGGLQNHDARTSSKHCGDVYKGNWTPSQ